MQESKMCDHLKTSVSLPQVSCRRLQASIKILARRGVLSSEQELIRRLFALYLKFWRGYGLKTKTLRRYNVDGRVYKIRPLYIDLILHDALWQRALYSGESLSRMLDVAIRLYLARLVEVTLRSLPSCEYWATRYRKRRVQLAEFFINYVCKTKSNDSQSLNYRQITKFIFNGGP